MSGRLAPFLRDGHLIAIPRRRPARLVLLDHLAGLFVPGRKYPESTVNALLAHCHPDFCALRRYLVEEGFMDRQDGLYWRTGGTVEV